MSNNAEMNRKSVKKTGLGRGLNSLLGGNDFDETPPAKTLSQESREVSPAKPEPASDLGRIWQVRIDKIVPNKDQPRKSFPKEHIESLARSIKEKGILQPISVRRTANQQFEIIAGERRWRAAQLAAMHEVPVIIIDSDDKQALEWALIENIQRQDLNPVEEAEAYFHLIKKYQMTQQELAEKLGKERATIANMLRLLNLSQEVQQMVSEGRLSLGQAKVLLSVVDPKKQKQLALKIFEKQLSVRAVEKLVAKEREEAAKGVLSDKVDTTSQLNIASLQSELQKMLGTKVFIDYHQGKGKMAINFYSDEELNNLVDHLRTAWRPQ